MKLRYVGPHDAVEVALPNGATTVVARGGEADFASEVGKSLAAQGDEHWQAPKTEKKKGA